MKQLVVLTGCVVFLLGLAGCIQHNMLPKIWNGEPPSHDALPDFFPAQNQTGAFPKSMVGKWEGDVEGDSGVKWGFKFEQDGSISELEHFFAGKVDLQQGGAYFQGNDPNNYAVFIIGPYEARYDTNTREVKVKVILDYYLMRIGGLEATGRCEDYLQGPVSEDGKTWKVEWRDYSWLEGAYPPDINEETTHPKTLVLTKID
jgi:hypothetical protein